MDELSTRLNSTATGCFLGIKLLNHLMYADDLTLISPSIIGMRKLLQACELFAAEHDIIFNPLKSKCLAFSKHRLPFKPGSLSLCDRQLVFVDAIKYLGVTLVNTLSDDVEISCQMRKLYASANALLKNFYRCSLRVKLSLFQAFCTNFLSRVSMF